MTGKRCAAILFRLVAAVIVPSLLLSACSDGMTANGRNDAADG